MNLPELSSRAVSVRQRFAALETAKYGRPWTREDVAMGLVGDIGDLMKHVMAHQGIRKMPGSEERIAHELADCLWSILVLAEMYGIGLEGAFLRTMDDIEAHIDGETARLENL